MIVLIDVWLGQRLSTAIHSDRKGLFGVGHDESHILDAIPMHGLMPDDRRIGAESTGDHETNTALLKHIRTPITTPVFGPGVGGHIKSEGRSVVVGGLASVPHVELNGVVTENGHEVSHE